MTRPPLVLRVRVVEDGRRKVRLWIPLFLLWPGVLLLLVALAPFAVVAALVLWRKGTGRRILLAAPLCVDALCAMRGLEVNVVDKDDRVYVSIW